MSGIPSKFYVASFKSRRSISRSSKLVMKEESQPSGKLRESAKSAFRRDTEKLLDWRCNIQIFGSLHKKKKGKEEKENCQKNCLGWTKRRQCEWEHATTIGTNHDRRWNDRSKWKRSTRRGDEMPNQITGSSQNEWLESECGCSVTLLSTSKLSRLLVKGVSLKDCNSSTNDHLLCHKVAKVLLHQVP